MTLEEKILEALRLALKLEGKEMTVIEKSVPELPLSESNVS